MKKFKEVMEMIEAIGMIGYWLYAANAVAEYGLWAITPDDAFEVMLLATFAIAGVLGVMRVWRFVKDFLDAYQEAKLAGLIAK